MSFGNMLNSTLREIYWGLCIEIATDSCAFNVRFASFPASLTNLSEGSDVTSITLALRTLGSFDFEGMIIFCITVVCS